jgi:hypothetical protein
MNMSSDISSWHTQPSIGLPTHQTTTTCQAAFVAWELADICWMEKVVHITPTIAVVCPPHLSRRESMGKNVDGASTRSVRKRASVAVEASPDLDT